jgi:hypothetical protein
MSGFVEWLKEQESALADKERAAVNAGKPLADIYLARGRVATALNLWDEYQQRRGMNKGS